MITDLYDRYLQNPKICTDTRKITLGCLFFALKGPHFNGNEFAKEALNKGASYAIVDDEFYVTDDRYILVKDSLTTLQDLARFHRNQLKCKILGITGSNGKTTSKELCLHVLKKKYNTMATLGNLNNHIGVPLSILSITSDTEIAIIEMGANHINEIEFLCGIAKPDYGVITNVGKAHLEGFGSLEGVLKGKTELYRYLATKNAPVFVKDNDYKLIDKIPEECRIIRFGELKNSNYIIQYNGAQPFVNVLLNEIQIQSQLIGDYNFDNIALSIAVGMEFGVESIDIKEGIESYVSSNNRSQIKKTNTNTILLDAYNSNPMSLKKAIQNLENIKHENKIIILGDMFELGEETNIEHQKIIDQCLKSGVSNVFLVGKIFNAINNSSYTSFDNIENLITLLKTQSIEDAFVLIKGSRGMKLEQVVDYL
ncbi:MAG: UDP-N-acetylmuramoyl-tripeptide--D-alanyl-D-alanine ligase [Cryomorphaceae bacterium]|nr:MAG: UDP-N-acetylmuramoyl-tripeptide--D-alanyl-D-alanine ligase [Cryomorphaceae bacterium]